MREHALKFGRNRSLVGILTENEAINSSEKNNLIGVLLLSTGLIHRVGPNRLYIKLARRLAGQGYVVLRFDLSGVGESGPRTDKMPANESVVDDARQAMDYLEQREGVKHFVCLGLCSGASVAARVLIGDPRVRKAILINLPLPRTRRKFLIEQSLFYRKHGVFSMRSWFRFFSMRSSYLDIWEVIRWEFKKRIRLDSFGDSELQNVTSGLKDFFQLIRTRGVQLLLIHSQFEFGDEYLKTVLGGEYQSIKNSGLLVTEWLRGADHLVTPLSSQERVLDLISRFLIESKDLDSR